MPEFEGNPSEKVQKLDDVVPTESTEGAVSQRIYTHASRKAEQMGLPLYVSQVSQNEEGAGQETEVPVGFTSEKSDKLLRSTASRAPKVYVDSADGETSWGKFTLNDLLQVQKAA